MIAKILNGTHLEWHNCLLYVVRKILAKIILQSIKEILIEKKKQIRFPFGSFCTEFKKAFDSVHRECIWNALLYGLAF